MNSINLAIQAAQMQRWPFTQEPDGLKLEIPTQNGRTQVVHMTMGNDGDGDPVAFIWSQAGDINNAQFDPWALLRFNTQLTYGRMALRGTQVVALHALHDANAQLAEVGKSLYWIARAADEVEQGVYGADRL